MTVRRLIFLAVTLAAIVLSFVPLVTGERNVPVHDHHLDHAVLMFLGGLAGLALYDRRGEAESPRWLWIAVLAPVVAMLLMAPTLYAIVDAAPWLHTVNHLAFVALAMLATYAGQRYVRGVGWASGLMLETMAIVAAFGYGVAPAATVSAASANSMAAVSPASIAHGRHLFAENCAACHGSRGQGGVGPTLKNESTRKDWAQVQAWIKKPVPPMPALYPAPLSASDVADVAAFVGTLK